MISCASDMVVGEGMIIFLIIIRAHGVRIFGSVAVVVITAGQLIQLMPASGFHFTVLFLSWVQNSIELLPVISPTPNLLSFHPPNENGSRGTGTPTFTPIIPALAFSMT